MEPDNQAKVVTEAAKELGITQLVPTLYQDLLQPAAKEVGQQLVVVAKAVGLALAPLQGAVWGYDQIKNYLAAKVAARLADKRTEEITPPAGIIAGPVVMGMAFAKEEPHLKEMYANLLASAMHRPTANRVHPSFVQVVQQLSPAEAQILRVIASSFSRRSVLFSERMAVLQNEKASQPSRIESFFRSNFLLTFDDDTILVQWRHWCLQCGVTDEALHQTYYRNLVRLGVLAEGIETTEEERGIFNNRTVEPKALIKWVELTEYGNLFLDVCVRDIPPTKKTDPNDKD